MFSQQIPDHRITETLRTFALTNQEFALVIAPKLNARGGDIAFAVKRDGAVIPLRWFEHQAEAETAFDGAAMVLRYLGLEKENG